MSLFTAADLTFEPEQAKALADVIKEKSFSTPELTTFHTIMEGIEAKKKIPILGHFGLLGKEGAGCNPVAQSANIPGSEKQWDPAQALIYVTQCYQDLMDSFWVYSMNKGVRRPDLTDTDFADFVADRLGVAQKEAILRWIWFGDVDAETVDGTPAGNLTSGQQEDYWTLIDGFWKQIFAIVTADSARKVAISENDEATYAAQAFSAADTTAMKVTGIFQDMIYNSDYRMRDQGGIIIATQSLVDQYARELRSVGTDLSFKRIEGGYTSIAFEGTQIYAFPFWDRMIRTYFDTGTKWHLPHRALFVNKDNLVIGTDSTRDGLQATQVFYDQVTDLNHWKSRFMLDAKVIVDSEIQAAY